MCPPIDADFYRRREHQERVQAERAACSHSRRIHQELADRYAHLLGRADRPQPRMQMAH